ncbi:hypothetical protein PsorP6_001405 [Peronosclerospora sorghi]|uniref:Uncharacterized protein n=1 Tax=Peronosclerospora sorghi TaxID=230839 RepID=A0ACC0WWK9_9STRA|nr:hypothetical protein PsorP6_001405 [Peronosclerospora sorghi]
MFHNIQSVLVQEEDDYLSPPATRCETASRVLSVEAGFATDPVDPTLCGDGIFTIRILVRGSTRALSGRSKQEGYGISIDRRNRELQPWLRCDKGGKSPAEQPVGHRQVGPARQNTEHNHPANEDPAVHPVHRHLTDGQTETVDNVPRSGARPRHVVAFLCEGSAQTC